MKRMANDQDQLSFVMCEPVHKTIRRGRQRRRACIQVGARAKESPLLNVNKRGFEEKRTGAPLEEALIR